MRSPMSAFEAPPSLLATFPRNTRSRRILQGVGSGAVARLLSSLITVISLPMAVRYLGAERYGVWATIASTSVWINLLDLGIANTLTNHISRAYAMDDRKAAAKSFTNALLVTGSVALLVAGSLCAVWPRINWRSAFNAGPAVGGSEIGGTVAAAAGLVLLSVLGNLGGKLLAGYQELHLNNLAYAVGTVANLAGLATGIWLRVSMPMLFVLSASGSTIAGLVNLTLVSTWYKPWLLPRPSLIDLTSARELLSSGSAFFLIQLSAVVVFSSDNLVVSHYCGAAEVTPYSVTWRFVGLAAVLQSLLFPALWPAYAEANATGDLPWIQRTFSKVMQGTLALNLAAVAVMMLFGRTLIRWWAGTAAVPTMAMLVMMGLWAVINGFMNVESCVLAALNRIRQQAWLSAAAAMVNLALSIFLVQRIGAVGVIAGTVLSYLLVLVVPQSLLVRRVLRGGTKAGHGKCHADRSESARADERRRGLRECRFCPPGDVDSSAVIPNPLQR